MNRMFVVCAVLLPLVGGSMALLHGAEVRIPAATAYLDANPEGAHVSERNGVTNWRGPALKVLWFGEFKTLGKLMVSVEMRLAKEESSTLRMTLGEHSRETTITGAGRDKTVNANFGEFEIGAVGYQRFVLESRNAEGKSNGDVASLVLDGPAIEAAHFNMKPRRNAASVHLSYVLPFDSKDAKVEWFYTEVTAVEDPVYTFYMACGFHRGYFGMQVNSPTERRIIFSVWDAGNGTDAQNRSTVEKENHVRLLAKGDGVHTNVFGGEGTGGHSHLKYRWKTGEPQRFLVTAKPTDDKQTIYSGYYFHPDQKSWMLISSMSAPKDGGYLRGLHSFSENFGDSNGHLRRKALFGNQWVRTLDGQWAEIVTAKFSHDPTGKQDRRDRFMGIDGGQHFLSHGGFVPGFTTFGDPFTRPPRTTPPTITLPPTKE